MAREDVVEAIMDALDFDEPMDFKTLMTKTRRGKTTLQRVLPELIKDGKVALAGVSKAGRGRCNLYVLDGSDLPPPKTSKFVIRVREQNMFATFGHFAILAAQVTP
jgi:hypothetical protein